MYLFLIHDARQRECRREGIQELVAIGGIIIPTSVARDLHDDIDHVCADFGFPDGEAFKWSPARDHWMRDNLTGQRRTAFSRSVLSAAQQSGAVAVVAMVETGWAPAVGAKNGFTDMQLADWFEVSERTINEWKLEHDEFSQSLRAGKAETDDLVERATVAHIVGYYVLVDELDRNGNIRQLRKWIPGNAHAGLKWLAARRPEVYREQKNVKHQLNMDDDFLRFLDLMEERAKLERARNARVIEHQPATDLQSPKQKPERPEIQAVDVQPE